MSSAPVLLWRLTAEFLVSAYLAAVVIGARIAAQRADPGSARAIHDGTSPFADRPSGPASPVDQPA